MTDKVSILYLRLIGCLYYGDNPYFEETLNTTVYFDCICVNLTTTLGG